MTREPHRKGSHRRSGLNGARERLARHAAEMADEVRGAAEAGIERVRDKAAEYVGDGRDRITGWERAIVNRIADRPFRSLLLAAGAGLLVSLFWRRQ